MRPRFLIVGAIVVAFCDAGWCSERPHDKYLAVVQAFADVMLEHGRDRLGPVETEMFLSVLDRDTLAPPQKLPPAPSGVREGDRCGNYGSNLQHQFNFLRCLEVLTELTGENRYREAAEQAVLDTFRYAQSDVTGLIGWGEHIYYDARKDRVASLVGETLIHEMKRPFPYWGLLYRSEPGSANRLALGLWEHQIGDQATGNFSRHANWERHDPRRDYDFPKEGSYMIDIWSQAYADSGDPAYLHAIKVLTQRYLSKITECGLLYHGDYHPQRCIPIEMLYLAINGHAAAQRLPAGEVREKLLCLTTRLDEGFQSLDHEPTRCGFIRSCFTDTGKVQPWRWWRDQRLHPGGHTPPWESGYGLRITAEFGEKCYARLLQLPDGTVKETYRQMVLDAADAYEGTDPPPDVDLWPRDFGYVIAVQLEAHQLTGDQSYIDRAKHFADLAVATFWDDTTPLPKASVHSDHYESVTMGDVLLYALLRLYLVLENQDTQISGTLID